MQYNKHGSLQKLLTSSGILLSFLTIAFCVDATDVSHGEVQAAIRSADFACNQVITLKSEGHNSWFVKCNSGKYLVTRDQNGKYSVRPID